jgi:hypothetical protein
MKLFADLVKASTLDEAENVVLGLSKKSGKSTKEVKQSWEKAKDIAAKEGHADDYEYITGITSRMLGLTESDGTETDSIEELILELLSFVDQTHIYHLLTKSYSDHMSIGEFYEDICKDVDQLAETYLGIVGGEFSNYDIYDTSYAVSYDKAEFIDELNDMRSDIVDGLEMTNDSTLMSLNNILVDIQGDIDSLLYKLILILSF